MSSDFYIDQLRSQIVAFDPTGGIGLSVQASKAVQGALQYIEANEGIRAAAARVVEAVSLFDRYPTNEGHRKEALEELNEFKVLVASCLPSDLARSLGIA